MNKILKFEDLKTFPNGTSFRLVTKTGREYPGYEGIRITCFKSSGYCVLLYSNFSYTKGDNSATSCRLEALQESAWTNGYFFMRTDEKVSLIFEGIKPITFKEEVPLNDKYMAVVEKDGVTVGCQKFGFDAISHLNQAIERAKNSKD